MSTVVDDRAQRHARARARAAAILDTPVVPRSFAPERGVRLQGSERRRLHGRLPAAVRPPGLPGRGRRRSVIAAAVVLQALALVTLLVHPAFRVRGIEVTGSRLLSVDAVQRVAGVSSGHIIFTLDGDGIRRRLLADPWIADAHVETALPGTIRVTVTEQTPVLRLRRPGVDELVAAGGQTLPVADVIGSRLPVLPLLEDARPTLAGVPATVDRTLLGVLASASAAFPKLVGVPASSFRWTGDGVLEVVAAPGWVAVFGHVDTPAEVAAIPSQLAALGALHGRVDFVHPTFGYINLEDPASVAVGGTPGAAVPVAAPAPAAPAPAPVPAPAAAAPSAAPRAAPTPVVVPSH